MTALAPPLKAAQPSGLGFQIVQGPKIVASRHDGRQKGGQRKPSLRTMPDQLQTIRQHLPVDPGVFLVAVQEPPFEQLDAAVGRCQVICGTQIGAILPDQPQCRRRGAAEIGNADRGLAGLLVEAWRQVENGGPVALEGDGNAGRDICLGQRRPIDVRERFEVFDRQAPLLVAIGLARGRFPPQVQRQAMRPARQIQMPEVRSDFCQSLKATGDFKWHDACLHASF